MLLSSNAYAHEYFMDKQASSIEASVWYTVLGRYSASFRKYESVFYFDPEHLERSSVEMTFYTKSIDSGMPRFDRIVRSSRLLDAGQYPEITFKSKRITKRADDYFVEGELTLHGVKRTLGFPFHLAQTTGNEISAQGSWQINRKSFNIIWHPVLDVGGILVGNKITIDWKIQAYNEPI